MAGLGWNIQLIEGLRRKEYGAKLGIAIVQFLVES